VPFSLIGALLMIRLWNETPMHRRATPVPASEAVGP